MELIEHQVDNFQVTIEPQLIARVVVTITSIHEHSQNKRSQQWSRPMQPGAPRVGTVDTSGVI